MIDPIHDTAEHTTPFRSSRPPLASGPASGRPAIVIASKDRAAELETTLGILTRLPDAGEIIVLDNASSDDTFTRVTTRFPSVCAIRLSRNLGAAARTIGAAVARSGFVAFSDDDSWWEPGSLETAADHLRRYPRLAVVAANLVVEPGGRPDPMNAIMRTGLPFEPDLPGTPVIGFIACASVVRRDAFLSVGGFDPRWFIGGEEMPVALDLLRRGWGLSFVEGVRAVHRPSVSRDAYGRRRDIGRNDAWAAWTRRPLRSAVRTTRRLMRDALRDPAVAMGMVHAVRGIPWVLRERRPIPTHLDLALSTLEAVQHQRHDWR
jgi:GT2 family glycosyltransferase